MPFTDDEIAYLRSQPITRFATVGPDDQPDVVLLAFEFDGHGFWVGGVGDAPAPASSETSPLATTASPSSSTT